MGTEQFSSKGLSFCMIRRLQPLLTQSHFQVKTEKYICTAVQGD